MADISYNNYGSSIAHVFHMFKDMPAVTCHKSMCGRVAINRALQNHTQFKCIGFLWEHSAAASSKYTDTRT